MERRLLVISDIHGNYDKFIQLLDQVNYNEKDDQLVLLGDYVDRGNQNAKTLLRVMELQKGGAIVLKGNHELFLQEAMGSLLYDEFNTSIYLYFSNGGLNTYNELKKMNKTELKRIDYFIKMLPLYYIIDNYLFVHAGVDARLPIQQNDSDNFLWSRDEFIYNKAYDDLITVFGHTPTFTINNNREFKIWKDKLFNDKIGIDCGSIFGGKLACLELPSMKEYYV